MEDENPRMTGQCRFVSQETADFLTVAAIQHGYLHLYKQILALQCCHDGRLISTHSTIATAAAYSDYCKVQLLSLNYCYI